MYLPIVGAVGQHSPEDVPNVYKQRGTWAIDTVRLLLFNRWRGLDLRQRAQFLEHDLDTDAHELDQLGQRRLVGLFSLAFIDAGARDLRQGAHDLAGIAREPLRIRGAGGAEPVHEAVAP